MDQRQYHFLQLHVDRLSFRRLDVSNPNHEIHLHGHTVNVLEQYVQPKISIVNKNHERK